MAEQKKTHKAIMQGYYYACCPFCKTILTQGKNGTDSYNLCPTCGAYIRVTICNGKVLTQLKESETAPE